MKSIRILLVNPSQMSKHMAKTSRTFMVPQNTLATVAALTPNDDVRIVDELVEELDYDADVDLVGITAMTDNVQRAYVVADEFRAREVPVVMGGAHPTACIEEALQHADAVVAGEAEGVWDTLVDEVRAGKRPSGVYRADSLFDMRNMVRPRRDLIQRDGYFNVDMVQTSRGCPYTCEFCSVHTLFGRGFRHRPVDEIVRELEECQKRIFFVDDTLNADPRFAKDLFRAITPLKKNWIAQMTVLSGKDPELVELMAESGCVGVFIGLESVDPDTLKHTGKKQNKVHQYIDSLNQLRRGGVPVLGAFVFGFDTDDEQVFDRTLEFLDRATLDLGQFTVLTPYPGTGLYERWEREGRLRFKDWWLHRHWTEVLFNPQQMTPEALQAGWVRTSVEYYRMSKIARRIVGGSIRHGFGKGLLISQMNLSYRESVWNMARDLGAV